MWKTPRTTGGTADSEGTSTLFCVDHFCRSRVTSVGFSADCNEVAQGIFVGETPALVIRLGASATLTDMREFAVRTVRARSAVVPLEREAYLPFGESGRGSFDEMQPEAS